MTRPGKLSDELKVRTQFARSVNVERDADSDVVDRYVPTARALDLLARVIDAMWSPAANRAWSVAGPYGSGKSSFAVFLDSLLGPQSDPHHAAAVATLRDVDPGLAERLHATRSKYGAEVGGFVRLSVTADREPITLTVAWAIEAGVVRHVASSRRSSRVRAVQAGIGDFAATIAKQPNSRAVVGALQALVELGPVLIVIDEFGKNVEYVSDGAADGDLFLLQAIAEASSGPNALPLAILTLQHLSLEDYLGTATKAQRREWSKVQGRFEEVAFADSPQQVRQLVATVIDGSDVSPSHRHELAAWACEQTSEATAIGLRGIADDPNLIAACYPLHPTSLVVLPGLCSHYGQNERTLFSFLAGPEPGAVRSFMSSTAWSKPLPTVRLDQLYDYFLDNPSTVTAGAANASRWFEVATRIRDLHSLTPDEQRCLKVVGLINLVSQGGALRASHRILSWALVGTDGFADAADVHSVLNRLCNQGVLAYRSFADEFRVWQGSDFDFAGALTNA